MAGTQGNQNLYLVAAGTFISYSTASESVTLPVGTQVVTLSPSTACWVKIGVPGETVTAAAIGSEKTWANRVFRLQAESSIDVPVPIGSDAHPVQIAVIRDTADGSIDILARKE